MAGVELPLGRPGSRSRRAAACGRRGSRSPSPRTRSSAVRAIAGEPRDSAPASSPARSPAQRREVPQMALDAGRRPLGPAERLRQAGAVGPRALLAGERPGHVHQAPSDARGRLRRGSAGPLLRRARAAAAGAAAELAAVAPSASASSSWLRGDRLGPPAGARRRGARAAGVRASPQPASRCSQARRRRAASVRGRHSRAAPSRCPARLPLSTVET